ncbi:MAG: glyoxylate/hydroxypyruvate reductase A [Gammaproteobacteria bacterium]|nr:glyoxylate/hydroxypyruvate reductase A [Gammaproteobacteria bacterium]NIR85795.1 glyoxylate/hydroxypyruvate reductase A [Gammaproteobacteria bacterium]NIR90549.1 glyoxylate/hydroxypyruvate reductase A [Gammaproteobacteria bacterium]NIU06930.1 glyoxylate/hydroxypyruvate reductase A [Gammaproteobacteria bacterium]NIV53860.1 glyoxylate/hydroxypyruvate reductase A [Gammaproteobacteria bacterium]
MSLLVVCPEQDVSDWVSALEKADPGLDLQTWPRVRDARAVTAALTWQHPPGELGRFPNLKVIVSMGAGVDHILRDPDLPDVPIVRLVDPSLVQSMTEYVVLAVLNHHRQLDAYRRLQTQRRWKQLPRPRPERLAVGIMGLGQLGAAAAQALYHMGFGVRGWSQTPKSLTGIRAFAGDPELASFLAATSVLVCLLPLTPRTENILCRRTFEQLRRGAYLINVGRGGHLVEADLLEALDAGQLSGACLDVFRTEPLPAEHPFWTHPRILVTPHVSSLTDPVAVAPQVVDTCRRVLRGEPLVNTVGRERGY